jgi:hypothetical protein
MTKKNDVFAMPMDALDKNVAQVLEAIEKAASQLPGLVTYTTEDRRSAAGKFRVGEADALLSVLDAAEKRPHLFESLADKDFGADPETFEVDLLRDRLQRAAKLIPLAAALDELNTKVSDTILELSANTRPVMLEAYGIAKSVAKTDAKLRGTIAPAIDFFARIARQSAETRRKNRATTDSK